jgi:hypothetical protein
LRPEAIPTVEQTEHVGFVTVDAGRADGFEDYVDCGPGNDWFSVGPEDTVVNCELEF